MKKILIFAMTAMFAVSCGIEKMAEINTNPAAVDTAEPSYLFLNAQNNLRGDQYNFIFYTGNRNIYPFAQMTVGDRGSLNGSTMFNGSGGNNNWSTFYVSVGGIIERMKYVIENLDEGQRNAYQYLVQMGEIIEAHAAIYCADYQGDMPYSEALQAPYTNPPLLTPVYDTQESVYKAIDAKMEAAVEILTNDVVIDGETIPQATISSQDKVYAGDATKWAKMANALRLKIAMRLMYADPTTAQAIAAEVGQSGLYMTSNADDYRFVASSTDGGPGTGVWPGTAAIPMVDYMKRNLDPRLRVFFDKNPYNAGVLNEMLAQGVTLPSYITDEAIIENDVFIRWKSADMGDGDEYLGEPWVRYQGIPVMQSGDLEQSVIDQYTTSDYFKVSINGSDRTFLPWSSFNYRLLGPTSSNTYPSAKSVQDVFYPEGAYNYTIVLVGAAECKLTLALFASLGVNVGSDAQTLFQEGITASVNAYEETAEHQKLLYYDEPYDLTTFTNLKGEEEVIEKSICLKDGELEAMLAKDAHNLTGETLVDLEKCYIQLMLNTFQHPFELYVYAKLAGFPKYNSTVWPREQFVKDAAVDAAQNIPRRVPFSTPDAGSVQYENQKAAFASQGFTDFSSASPPMTERYWMDINAPDWGDGPKIP